jgi:hypothetical protein
MIAAHPYARPRHGCPRHDPTARCDAIRSATSAQPRTASDNRPPRTRRTTFARLSIRGTLATLCTAGYICGASYLACTRASARNRPRGRSLRSAPSPPSPLSGCVQDVGTQTCRPHRPSTTSYVVCRPSDEPRPSPPSPALRPNASASMFSPRLHPSSAHMPTCFRLLPTCLPAYLPMPTYLFASLPCILHCAARCCGPVFARCAVGSSRRHTATVDAPTQSLVPCRGLGCSHCCLCAALPPSLSWRA